MLLLFRFLYVIVRSRFRSRLGPLDESVVRFTVLPHDCDLNFHLNAGRFVSFMDIARVELIGRTRLLGMLLRRGWRPVMGGCVVRYRRSILPFERFDIRTRVVGWDEKWIYVEHVVEKDGEFCAIGHMRTVIRGRNGTIAPQDVLALLKLDGLESPALPEFVQQWRTSEDQR
ncbi:MAG TPA: thioesterase family protein [Thermoanaerobaculia bacterium]|nr:thioesterase family protein [Thermoanaerobaculia bacterium]